MPREREGGGRGKQRGRERERERGVGVIRGRVQAESVPSPTVWLGSIKDSALNELPSLFRLDGQGRNNSVSILASKIR